MAVVPSPTPPLQLIELGTVTASNTGGVAYLAHIGGVVFGAAFGRLFEKPRRLQVSRWPVRRM